MRDKNKLPIDMLCEIMSRGTIYGSLRDKFQKRFGCKDWYDTDKKIDELKEIVLSNIDSNLTRIFENSRITSRYLETRKNSNQRMSPEYEKIFFEKQKNSYVYYEYCRKHGIIIEEFNQVVTEVALNCENTHQKKYYLDGIIKKRKDCKKFLEQHIELLEIPPEESIKKLLESLG